MKHLDIWPKFDHGTTFGAKYTVVNNLLNQVAGDLGVNLWTLDNLWHFHLFPPEGFKVGGGDVVRDEEEAEFEQRFGLERHLHEFLRDNWDKTELGKEWTLYQEQAEPEAGYEYPCDVGRIDLLAVSRNPKARKWLVVELKKGNTSDKTVGQVLRYVGWVKEHLAQPGDKVEGMVIAHDADDRLYYALKAVPGISLMLYEVQFRMKMAGLNGRVEQT